MRLVFSNTTICIILLQPLLLQLSAQRALCQLFKFVSALFGQFQGLITDSCGFDRVNNIQKKWRRHYRTKCTAFYVYISIC